ncbi:Cullin-2 [Globomyces sp. JEL0801]|nr:Cullin-2 [Globomyces sp. JEL0801]
MAILKFGPQLPPLPMKPSDVQVSPTLSPKSSSASLPASRVGSAGKRANIQVIQEEEEDKEIQNNPDGVAAIQASVPVVNLGRNGVPSRRVISERREISIQEFLKKGQIEFGSINLFANSKSTGPYSSRYKFTPTIDVEMIDSEEEEDILYRIQIRGWKLNPNSFDTCLFKVKITQTNFLHSLWNCGLTESHFPIILSIMANGNIRKLCLDQNPLVPEGNYSSLLGEDSILKSFSLRGNNITDIGAKLLAAALKTNRTLTSLDLFNNRINKYGAEAFAEALANYPLSPDEIQLRKKQMTENDRQKEVEDDPAAKKKRGNRPISSTVKSTDKDKKGAKANAVAPAVQAAPAATKKGAEPVPPKGPKADDQKNNKKTVATPTPVQPPVDDKSKNKKAAPVPKSKKGKPEDMKEELEEHNPINYDHPNYCALNSLLNSRNPFYEPVDDLEVHSADGINENADFDNGDIEESAVNFEETFEMFRVGLVSIFLSNQPVEALPDPYEEKLLKGILNFISDHTLGILKSLANQENVVLNYGTSWKSFKDAAEYTNSTCQYLNEKLKKKANPYRDSIKDQIIQLTIQSHAFNLWQTNILLPLKQNHQNILINQILEFIKSDRDGCCIDPILREQMKESIFSLINLHSHSENPLDLYIQEFEIIYLEETTKYYKNEAGVAMNRDDLNHMTDGRIIKFLEKILMRIEDETKRSINYLHPSSYEKSPLNTFEEHVAIMATELASKVTAEDQKAFRKILNNAGDIDYPEIFSKYFDMHLKRPAKGATVNESDCEKKLIKLVELFAYLDEKDVFQKFYSRSLAKRLLYSSSLSTDLEMSIISQLKLVCGIEYTSKMQRMFTDVTLNDELNGDFKKFVSSKLEVDFNVLVLTTGSWPIPPDNQTYGKLPKEIEVCITDFTSFYINQLRRVGRRLTWNHQLSRGEIRLTYLERKYDMSLTLRQFIVVDRFNYALSLSVDQIKDETSLPEIEIRKILKALVEQEILLENNGENSFEINFKFSRYVWRLVFMCSKRVKLKLPQTSSTNPKEESTMVKKAVEDDRQFFIQACIVRIMKSKQKLSHTTLVSEVIQQSAGRFHPTISIIKKCIEGLIDKQYLGRTDEKDQYVYIS